MGFWGVLRCINKLFGMSNNKFIWGDEIEAITDPQFKQHLYLIYAKISRNPLFKYIKDEGHLQIFVSQYVKFKYPNVLCHHSPNEGKRGTFARWMIGLFVVHAVPDIMIYAIQQTGHDVIDSYGLAIELKVGRNKPTDRQVACMLQLDRAGWKTRTHVNFADAKNTIDAYLG